MCVCVSSFFEQLSLHWNHSFGGVNGLLSCFSARALVELPLTQSLTLEQVLFEVFRADAGLVWEESTENRVLVCIERGRVPVVEVADDFVIAQHSNRYLFESAPFVNGQELG